MSFLDEPPRSTRRQQKENLRRDREHRERMARVRMRRRSSGLTDIGGGCLAVLVVLFLNLLWIAAVVAVVGLVVKALFL